MESPAALRRVFIVEDAPSVRTRLVELIQDVAGTRVVGEAATPQAAIEGILRTRPDCVILDLHLRGGTGLEVLRQLRAKRSESAVIVLTNHADPTYRSACLASGARWFFDKSKDFDKVQAVVAGIVPFSYSDGA